MGAKRKKIMLSKQFAKVKKDYENWDCRLLANSIILIGNIKPTALSSEYKVKVSYSLSEPPIITIMDPKLELHPNATKLPHVFEKKRLCLHYKEFDSYSHYLADTIIVWITWWLLFYETWLVTGVWNGGGIEHNS